MKPTNKLRFVERIERTGEQFMFQPKEKILQQWWEIVELDMVAGEWRDVPIEVEE